MLQLPRPNDDGVFCKRVTSRAGFSDCGPAPGFRLAACHCCHITRTDLKILECISQRRGADGELAPPRPPPRFHGCDAGGATGTLTLRRAKKTTRTGRGSSRVLISGCGNTYGRALALAFFLPGTVGVPAPAPLISGRNPGVPVLRATRASGTAAQWVQTKARTQTRLETHGIADPTTASSEGFEWRQQIGSAGLKPVDCSPTSKCRDDGGVFRREFWRVAGHRSELALSRLL